MTNPLAPWEAPWQAPIPAPYSLPFFKYDSTAKDELGNDKPEWLAAQMIPVQGWDMMTSEKLAEAAAEEDFDAFLLTPVDTWLALRDRVALPLPENGMTAPTTFYASDGVTLNSGIFVVVGHDIESYGPQFWTPGNVTLLKLVEG
jgi:hypothetical protein